MEQYYRIKLSSKEYSSPNNMVEGREMNEALSQWMEKIGINYPDGNLPLKEAQKFRADLNNYSSKAFKNSLDPGKDIKVKVANELAHNIGAELANVIGPRFKDIDKTYAELIPIQEAAKSRDAVTARNKIIGLIDGAGALQAGTAAMLGHPAAAIPGLGLAAINHAARSGEVANKLYNLSLETPKIARFIIANNRMSQPDQTKPNILQQATQNYLK